MTDTAARILAVAAAVRAARSSRERSVLRIAEELTTLFAARAEPARRALASALARERTTGTPPSFVRVAGLGHREKPYNRLLGWWLADGDHGAGFSFLSALATRVGLAHMAEDISRGERPEIHVETAMSDDETKEPDAVVLTSRAALLLENKVWAGESGDQYGPYLASFKRSTGERQWMAILLAREVRATPAGWSMMMTHEEIAEVLASLTRDDGLPFWARVSAQLTAAAFADAGDDSAGTVVSEGRRLLALPRPSAQDVTRMEALAKHLGMRQLIGDSP